MDSIERIIRGLTPDLEVVALVQQVDLRTLMLFSISIEVLLEFLGWRSGIKWEWVVQEVVFRRYIHRLLLLMLWLFLEFLLTFLLFFLLLLLLLLDLLQLLIIIFIDYICDLIGQCPVTFSWLRETVLHSSSSFLALFDLSLIMLINGVILPKSYLAHVLLVKASLSWLKSTQERTRELSWQWWSFLQSATSLRTITFEVLRQAIWSFVLRLLIAKGHLGEIVGRHIFWVPLTLLIWGISHWRFTGERTCSSDRVYWTR